MWCVRVMPQHKFKIGEWLFPSRSVGLGASDGAYIVVKRLPERGGEFEYQIKSVDGPHQCVVRESQLRPNPWPRHPGRMGMIKLLAAPVRRIVRFPLFQLAFVVAVILFLQAGDDKSARGQIFNGLDDLVESTVGLFSAVFNVKSFTKSWLTTGFWIAYVYLACLLILSLLRVVISKVVDFVGWSNLFGLRNAIARERGIAAYRAWVPLERIRPVSIPQEKWEETFAWPANNEPPYPPLAQRILGGMMSYVTVGLVAAVLYHCAGADVPENETRQIDLAQP